MIVGVYKSSRVVQVGEETWVLVSDVNLSYFIAFGLRDTYKVLIYRIYQFLGCKDSYQC